MDTMAAITTPRIPRGSTACTKSGMADEASLATPRAYAVNPIMPVTMKKGMENRPLRTVPRAVPLGLRPISSRWV